MTSENNNDLDYDEWLETWKGSPHLDYACLDHNLIDPYAHARLLADVEAKGDVPRAVKLPGLVDMDDDEVLIRRREFLESRRNDWSHDFLERIAPLVDPNRLRTFLDAMAQVWVLPGAHRQQSTVMRKIKASIQAHDRTYHSDTAGRFVIEDEVFNVDPLFQPHEVAGLLEVNRQMLQYTMAEYIEAIHGERQGSLDDVILRRGVSMPIEPGAETRERSYLSSYSLAIGPSERFARTIRGHSSSQFPCIFNCRMAALQDRVIAFAAFIPAMPLDQMEFVVAPPTRAMALERRGEYGGIREYFFD
jgi:hypothetical protein